MRLQVLWVRLRVWWVRKKLHRVMRREARRVEAVR